MYLGGEHMLELKTEFKFYGISFVMEIDKGDRKINKHIIYFNDVLCINEYNDIYVVLQKDLKVVSIDLEGCDGYRIKPAKDSKTYKKLQLLGQDISKDTMWLLKEHMYEIDSITMREPDLDVLWGDKEDMPIVINCDDCRITVQEISSNYIYMDLV